MAGIVLQIGVPIQGAYQAQAQQVIEPMSVITRFCESMMIMCELSHFNKTNWNVSTYKFTSELLIEKIYQKKHKNAIKNIKTSIDKYSAIYKEYEMGGLKFHPELNDKRFGAKYKNFDIDKYLAFTRPRNDEKEMFPQSSETPETEISVIAEFDYIMLQVLQKIPHMNSDGFRANIKSFAGQAALFKQFVENTLLNYQGTQAYDTAQKNFCRLGNALNGNTSQKIMQEDFIAAREE